MLSETEAKRIYNNIQLKKSKKEQTIVSNLFKHMQLDKKICENIQTYSGYILHKDAFVICMEEVLNNYENVIDRETDSEVLKSKANELKVTIDSYMKTLSMINKCKNLYDENLNIFEKYNALTNVLINDFKTFESVATVREEGINKLQKRQEEIKLLMEHNKMDFNLFVKYYSDVRLKYLKLNNKCSSRIELLNKSKSSLASTFSQSDQKKYI